MLSETRDEVQHRIFEVPNHLKNDARWIAVLELSSSPAFARSPRLSQLLLYLAVETLLERAGHISEHQIAHLIFGRNADFDPASDTIVRSHLLRLRQRLDRLPVEGSNAAFSIRIPKGQYAVEFAPKFENPSPSEEVSTSPEEVVIPPQQPTESFLRRNAQVWQISILVLLVLISVRLFSLRRSPEASTPTHPLWSRMFLPSQNTTVVAADSSLVVLHGAVGHETPLADYISRSYLKDAEKELQKEPELLGTVRNRYSSAVDVSVASQLSDLAARYHSHAEARFARELRIEDLKRGNALLSGSRGANPWVELYEPQMNFVIQNDYVRGRCAVLNRHPHNGESIQYIAGQGNAGDPLYGVLAFLPNLEPSANVILMEGTSLAATEAVRDFLFDDKALLPFLSTVQRKDGSLRHFEVLFASTVINGNASKFQIVTYRTYD